MLLESNVLLAVRYEEHFGQSPMLRHLFFTPMDIANVGVSTDDDIHHLVRQCSS